MLEYAAALAANVQKEFYQPEARKNRAPADENSKRHVDFAGISEIPVGGTPEDWREQLGAIVGVIKLRRTAGGRAWSDIGALISPKTIFTQWVQVEE